MSPKIRAPRRPRKPLHEIPCAGKGPKVWALTEAKAQEWALAFPAVDIPAEVLRAKQWLTDNPAHRKTHQGMPAYFGRWFAKVQDRAPRVNGKTAPEQKRVDPMAGIHFDPDAEYPPDDPESAPLARCSPPGGSSGQASHQDGKKALSGSG